mgnify:CR=1 FL=1
MVFYESPYRILKTLGQIEEILGNIDICICRELTKKYEEIYRGKISDIKDKVRPQGEFTVILNIS